MGGEKLEINCELIRQPLTQNTQTLLIIFRVCVCVLCNLS